MDVLVRRVKTYLSDNPRAIDTIEGIAKYWVPGAKEADLQAALHILVNDGILSIVRMGGRSQGAHMMRSRQFASGLYVERLPQNPQWRTIVTVRQCITNA